MKSFLLVCVELVFLGAAMHSGEKLGISIFIGSPGGNYAPKMQRSIITFFSNNNLYFSVINDGDYTPIFDAFTLPYLLFVFFNNEFS